MIDIITVEKDQRNSQFVEKLLKVWEDSVRASHYFLTEEDIIGLTPQAEEALRGCRALFRQERPYAVRRDGVSF